MYKIVYLDTETTGLVKEDAGLQDQPHLLSVSVISEQYDYKTGTFTQTEEYEMYSKEAGELMTEESMKVNGITLEFLEENGFPRDDVHQKITNSLDGADLIICHNTKFDMQILWFEALRSKNQKLLYQILTTRNFCTSINSRYFKINYKGGKHMKLVEMFKTLFGYEFDGQHTAIADTRALRDCVHELLVRSELRSSQLTASPRYGFITIEKGENDFTVNVTKKCVFSKLDDIKNTFTFQNVHDLSKEMIHYLDDCIAYFFLNKVKMDEFIRYGNISDHKTLYGFRIATHLNSEDENDIDKLIELYNLQPKKFSNGITLLKDNGFFY